MMLTGKKGKVGKDARRVGEALSPEAEEIQIPRNNEPAYKFPFNLP